ncbi:MAG: 2'-5' RNA ligase family protein [Chthoniobacterales bacterium]
MRGDQKRKEIIAYWLLPAEPAREYFSSIIRDLAKRYHAPSFEPHLTIFIAPSSQLTAATALRETIADVQPIRLSVRGVGYSDAFTKTAFVEFDSTPPLREIAEAFRRKMPSAGDDELNPHLSLLYKAMSHIEKERIAKSLSSLPSEVEFNCAKAILCRVPIETRADVESWRTVAVEPLRPGGGSR